MQNQELKTTLLSFKISGSDLLSMTVRDAYDTIYRNIKSSYLEAYFKEIKFFNADIKTSFIYLPSNTLNILDKASRIANIIAVKKSFKLFNYLNSLIEIEPLRAVVNLKKHYILIYKYPTIFRNTHAL